MITPERFAEILFAAFPEWKQFASVREANDPVLFENFFASNYVLKIYDYCFDT
jgi:hypothetical protein